MSYWLMSALWTLCRQRGASPWGRGTNPGRYPGAGLIFRRLAPCHARAGLGDGAWRLWFDVGSISGLLRGDLLHEGRDLLAKGCAYCTKAPPTCSTPNPLPVAPDPRAVHPDDAGSHHSDRGAPSSRLKQQLSHLADAPNRCLETS